MISWSCIKASICGWVFPCARLYGFFERRAILQPVIVDSLATMHKDSEGLGRDLIVDWNMFFKLYLSEATWCCFWSTIGYANIRHGQAGSDLLCVCAGQTGFRTSLARKFMNTNFSTPIHMINNITHPFWWKAWFRTSLDRTSVEWPAYWQLAVDPIVRIMFNQWALWWRTIISGCFSTVHYS